MYEGRYDDFDAREILTRRVSFSTSSVVGKNYSTKSCYRPKSRLSPFQSLSMKLFFFIYIFNQIFVSSWLRYVKKLIAILARIKTLEQSFINIKRVRVPRNVLSANSIRPDPRLKRARDTKALQPCLSRRESLGSKV